MLCSEIEQGMQLGDIRTTIDAELTRLGRRMGELNRGEALTDIDRGIKSKLTSLSGIDFNE